MALLNGISRKTADANQHSLFLFLCGEKTYRLLGLAEALPLVTNQLGEVGQGQLCTCDEFYQLDMHISRSEG